MKTIFTFLSSILLSISLMAADIRQKSSLIIRSDDRNEIRVVIDGRRFESRDNFMRIRNIGAGHHRVKIYRQRNNRGVFGNFGNRYELIYNSSLRVRPGMNVLMSIDRYGRVQVQERRIRGYGRNDRWENDRDRNHGYGNDRDRDYDRDFDDNGWDRGKDFDFDQMKNSGDYDMNDRDWDQDDRDYNDHGRAMSDIDFSRVMESIQKEWFEGNKQKSASQIISTNYLTSLQVKQLLQLFSFENTKLELAKQAYPKTVDKRNFYVVNEVFSFSSSKDELNRFIRNGR